MLEFEEMIIQRKKDQIKFKSPACGYLFEVVKSDGFGIIRAEGINKTGRHYHKKMTETYHLLKGEMTLEIQEKGKEIKIIEMKSGDVVVVQPYDIHKVIKGSSENELLVTSVPDWTEKDEIVLE